MEQLLDMNWTLTFARQNPAASALFRKTLRWGYPLYLGSGGFMLWKRVEASFSCFCSMCH